MPDAGAEIYKDKLAVVTGGASGIGMAVARTLLGKGASAVRGDIQDSQDDVRSLDVRDRDSVVTFFDALDHAPDILVTCAGGAQRRAALDVDDDLMNDTLQLNLAGFWRCTQEASKRAIAEKRPLSVVHVASSLHRGPAPELSHFAAANAGSVTLVRCLAQELAPHHIRVNAVIPGPVETPATTPLWDARPNAREQLQNALPLGRIAVPEDIVPAILWLASDEASWATGSVLTIDGGLDVAS